MSIFNSFKNNEVKVEEAKDVVGGGVSFGILETGAYNCKIKQAYVDYSKGGAMSINFEFQSDTGNIFRSQQWVTSGNSKGNKNYYTDSKGNNQYLPGYTLVNDICALAAGTYLADMDTDERMVKIYDFAQGKQVDVAKQVITDLLGKDILLTVEKQIVDKNVKNDAGDYVPSGETREVNEVVKAFCPDDEVTVTEKKAGLTEASFLTKWVEKNEGQTKDKSKGASATGAAVVNPAQPKASDIVVETPAKSIFG